MFEGIGASGWLVILCALALGFGVAKFLLVESGTGRAARPPVSQSWHEVLGVPADAPWDDIQAAYECKLASCSQAEAADLGPDFVAQAQRTRLALGEALAAARNSRPPGPHGP